MFKAVVTICLINSATVCMILENFQYPVVYETYEQCKERALEMGSQVPEYMPKWKAIRWKCIKIKEGRFTGYQTKGE
jgi:hypothetical protein